MNILCGHYNENDIVSKCWQGFGGKSFSFQNDENNNNWI